MSFQSLNLPDYLLQTLESLGFQEPTPVQEQAIPHVLSGSDVIGVAQTGTGKTAAFALPLIKQLNDAPASTREMIQVLTVVPTRELALQVAAAFRSYAKHSPQRIEVLALIGGTDVDKQIRALSHGTSIIVATPGRLLDLVDRGEVRLAALKTLVLDEADKLLDLGFAEELETLLEVIPTERQNLLFSATFPDKVAVLSERFLTEPVRVSITPDQPLVEAISQRVIQVDATSRRMLLQHLLEQEPWDQVLVFVATKIKARNLSTKLHKAGYSAAGFHGDLEQDVRIHNLKRFKRGSFRVLVATDVAARGIDIEKLSCVVNFDLPRSPNDYLHRIGRTGRAGESGVALSFVDHETEAQFRVIEKKIGQRIPREQIEGFELSGEAPDRVKGPDPVKGKRKSKKDKLREQAARDAASNKD